MLVSKIETWPSFLLLALVIFSLSGYAGSSVAAESKGNFYERLEALSSGNKELSYAARQAFEATAYDPREGLAGVKLGMSMEDVIGVWGNPKRVCMQAAATVLSMARGSQFSFVENELVSARIHSADLPAMKLSNGVDFSFSPSRLGSLYKIRNPSGHSYVTDVTAGSELQFYYSNLGNKGLRMITMALIKRP
jgi:hypothetical protein